MAKSTYRETGIVRETQYASLCFGLGRFPAQPPLAPVPISILIVDDHEFVRRVLRTSLETAGFTVCGEAIDGYEALEKAAELTPDVIVLDLRMPKINGVEVASVLRQRHSKSKVIAFSIYHLGETLSAGCGIAAVIAKADGLGKLVDCIVGLTDKPDRPN